MQDARPLASKGFRPPFGLGRVTFLCVAKEKSPKERPPRQSDRCAVALGSGARSDGPPQTALWPSPSMASAKARFEHPVFAPNRVELRSPFPDLAPVPAASAPSSLMALLTLPLPLGGLEGEPKPCPP
ncbi:hypothetical protein D3C72_748990 [compost metagenome]